MDTNTVIWIVVAVVVALLLIGLAVWAMRKRKDNERAENARRAQELRHEADRHAEVIPDARLKATEADVKAEKLRLEAERAEARAEEAKTSLAQQEARYEDQVREADRLDPHGTAGRTDTDRTHGADTGSTQDTAHDTTHDTTRTGHDTHEVGHDTHDTPRDTGRTGGDHRA